jgi:nucleoside-diphosphate-sugar epimerase
LTKLFERHKLRIEGIIHTAAMTSYLFYDNPHRSVHINIVGTLNILELARTFEIKKIVYTSSGAVYGTAKNASEMTAINPQNLYGATKASAEFMGLQYGNHWKLDFRVARLYFLYGPPMLPSKYPMVIRALFGPLEGLDHLKLESGGDQPIDFTYVKDAAKGVSLLYNAKNLKNKVFNITSGQATKLSDVSAIVKNYSPEFDIEIGPGYTSFPDCSTIDISLARQELGFEPEYTLEKGVAEYAEWVKRAKKILD